MGIPMLDPGLVGKAAWRVAEAVVDDLPGLSGAERTRRLAEVARQVAAGIERYEASVRAEFRTLMRRGCPAEGPGKGPPEGGA